MFPNGFSHYMGSPMWASCGWLDWTVMKTCQTMSCEGIENDWLSMESQPLDLPPHAFFSIWKMNFPAAPIDMV